MGGCESIPPFFVSRLVAHPLGEGGRGASLLGQLAVSGAEFALLVGR